MKVSIGHRLFASVLLATLVVAASGIALMRQKVVDSFADYAVKIELDRLDELSGALARQYRQHGNWGFIDGDPGQRSAWIAWELAQLQQRRIDGPPLPPPAPPAPPAPAIPSTAAPELLAGELPVPPLPPLPPPAVPAGSAGSPKPPTPGAPAHTVPVAQLALQDRVTLFNAAGHYLAGLPGTELPGARRPILLDGRQIGALFVARGSRPSDPMAGAFLGQFKDSVLLIVAVSVALSALAAMLLAAHFRQPILRLAEAARALTEGRYHTRLALARSDELGQLAHSFNQLAGRLDQVETSRRQWVADTSHELRTPLSVLRAQLEALQDGIRSADPDSVAAMLRQVMSLTKLIDELYTLARADVGALEYQRERLDCWQLAREQAAAFTDKFAASRLQLDCTSTAPVMIVMADPERLRQVFSNLFENCIRHCSAGAQLRLAARMDGDSVLITLDDSAPGVPAAALARLAERFYRVEGSRSREHGGAGLGLAMCERIVGAHGGQLDFAHSGLGGLQVRLRLPREMA